jgi:hypothetical protein
MRSHDPSPLSENLSNERIDLCPSGPNEGVERGRVVADRPGSALEVAQPRERAEVGVVGE